MSPEKRLRAQRRAAANHVDWFGKLSTRAQLLFPALESPDVPRDIDRVVADARAHRVEASCWSLVPAQPVDLGASLLARGFQWGWQPHWRLDLANWGDGLWRPDGVTIERATERHVLRDDLPNYPAEEAAVLQRLPQSEAVQLAAIEHGNVVGHVVVSRCAKDNTAGLYSCGVVEVARRSCYLRTPPLQI